ncbi:MAG: hypothetical protein HYY06_11805 [Deltaproteobacteria bacterium]|nr:hypothetical protein [Deltaproteobacteria bacterium]
MSEALLPPSLRPRDDVGAIFEDIAPYVGRSIEERSAMVSDLCRLAAAQLSARPDWRRVLAYQDPRSPESEGLWMRLVSAARQTRSP